MSAARGTPAASTCDRVAGFRARLHVPRALPQGEDGAVEIDVDQLAIGGDVHVGERHPAGDAGIGDHRVDPAHCIERAGEAGDDRGLAGHIDDIGEDPHPMRAQCGGRLFILVGAPPPENDVAAGTGETASKAETQPRIGARDQRHLAAQIEQIFRHVHSPDGRSNGGGALAQHCWRPGR